MIAINYLPIHLLGVFKQASTRLQSTI